MAHLEYVDTSERRSRHRRRSRSPSRLLPPAPELDDWATRDDEEPDSPPRSSRHSRHGGEIIRSGSKASTAVASSHHRRRRPSTHSHSLSSSASMAMRAPHPPLSSMTRPTTVPYRRPSAREYDDEEVSRSDSRMSDSRRDLSPRSAHHYRSTPRSRRSSRTSESGSDDETEITFDSQADRRARREERVRHIVREESRDDRIRQRRRHRRHEQDMEDDEYEERQRRSRHTSRHRRPSIHEERLRSRSRHSECDRHDDHDDHDDDPEPRERHDRHHEHNGHHKHRHSSRRRQESVSSAKTPSPPKRHVLKAKFEGTPESRRPRSSKKYYESEEKRPSSSLRRSSTISGSTHVAVASSVSSSTKRSSSSFLGNFFGPSLHAHHPPDRVVKLVDCVVCMDDLSPKKTARLKCGHRVCQNCLKRSFKLSLTDPQHMPPKCCTTDNIPLKHVDRLFDNDFKKTWNKKFVEYSTRNRIYCPSKRCNEFIKPENIRHHPDDPNRKYGKCGKCKTKVCVTCNGKWHSSRDCPKDEETVKLLAQAKDEGWQRCYRCKAMVELKEGCNHMTCRCGAEFCMICGSRWKSCECQWFNYETVENDRLLHMQIPLPHEPGDAPRFAPGHHQGHPPPPGGPRALPHPRNYDEELLRRRLQEGGDEEYARRLQNRHGDYDDDHDPMGGVRAEIIGFGNQAGHFMNENFRLRPLNNMNVPPPPPPPGPVPLGDPFQFQPPNAQTDYITEVRRARGVNIPRSASMERRLADRFNNRPGPPQLQTSATMPMMPTSGPGPVPHAATAPVVRRNIMEDDVYVNKPTRSTLSAERVPRVVPIRTRHVYTEEVEDSPPAKVSPRKQHVIQEPPKSSVMAGLTGPGGGMNRVLEWSQHVRPGKPDEDTAATA